MILFLNNIKKKVTIPFLYKAIDYYPSKCISCKFSWCSVLCELVLMVVLFWCRFSQTSVEDQPNYWIKLKLPMVSLFSALVVIFFSEIIFWCFWCCYQCKNQHPLLYSFDKKLKSNLYYKNKIKKKFRLPDRVPVNIEWIFLDFNWLLYAWLWFWDSYFVIWNLPISTK